MILCYVTHSSLKLLIIIMISKYMGVREERKTERINVTWEKFFRVNIFFFCVEMPGKGFSGRGNNICRSVKEYAVQEMFKVFSLSVKSERDKEQLACNQFLEATSRRMFYGMVRGPKFFILMSLHKPVSLPECTPTVCLFVCLF